MSLRGTGFPTVALSVAMLLSGCATTSVEVERESAVRVPQPSVVLVHRFGANLSEVTENQSVFQQGFDATQSTTTSERDAGIASGVSERMADELVARIAKMGLAARRADAGTDVPSDALVITGYFVDIDEGNRLRRLVIGFGAGQSTLDAEGQLRHPSGSGYETLLAFKTHADSGEMPGAAVTMGAGAAAQGAVTGGMAVANVAVSGVKGVRSEVDAMAGRSADRAAEVLSEFFARNGWIAPDRVQKPLL